MAPIQVLQIDSPSQSVDGDLIIQAGVGGFRLETKDFYHFSPSRIPIPPVPMDIHFLNQIELRYQPRAGDRGMVEQMVRETGKFNAEEIQVALELIDAALEQGESAGYEFVFAQWNRDQEEGLGGPLLGYACFGRIPGTEHSYDLYWVVVDRAMQGRGVGRRLLGAVEQQVMARCGSQIYIDTSGRSDYRGTRDFYAASGYSVVAELPDFYGVGDSKVIFHKKL